MEPFNVDLLFLITDNLDDKNLLNLALISKNVYNKLFKNKIFWTRRLERWHGIKYEEIDGKEDSFLCYKCVSEESNNEDGILTAIKNGSLPMVHFFIKNGNNDWNGALYWASRCNQIEIIDYLLSLNWKEIRIPPDYEYALSGSIEGKHKDLIDRFYALGAKYFECGCIHDYNHTLFCHEIDEEFFEYLIKNYRFNIDYHRFPDTCSGFYRCRLCSKKFKLLNQLKWRHALKKNKIIEN